MTHPSVDAPVNTRVALPKELLQFFTRVMRVRSPHAQTVWAYGDEHGLPCTRVDPEWFFVDGPTDPDRIEKWQATRNLCAACPVQVACREWALDSFARGFWGGTTDSERARERARRAQQDAA